MRVLVISDTHGRHGNLKKVLKTEPPFDLVIHLGDAEGTEEYIAQMADCPLEIVSGNSDFFSALCPEKEILVGKYKILITHGHYYNVNAGIEDIKKEAEGRDCGIVMFWHTHRPLLKYTKKTIIVNPGSLSYPRQEGKEPSYIIMETDQNGDASFQIRYLEEI